MTTTTMALESWILDRRAPPNGSASVPRVATETSSWFAYDDDICEGSFLVLQDEDSGRTGTGAAGAAVGAAAAADADDWELHAGVTGLVLDLE